MPLPVVVYLYFKLCRKKTKILSANLLVMMMIFFYNIFFLVALREAFYHFKSFIALKNNVFTLIRVFTAVCLSFLIF